MSLTHYAYTKRWRANNPEKVKNARWQEKEIRLLLSNKYSSSELSHLLGRSVRSISNKRYWLKRQHKDVNYD